MSTQTTQEPRVDGDEQFPIHFENNKIRIFTNPCDEVFIVAKETGVQMRLNVRDGGIELTAFQDDVKPIVIAGSIGYRVQRPAS